MIQDIKFAIRRLLKAPGFTVAAVIVLALGIGVNTAVFSLVRTMLFAPPAFAQPAEMVQVFSQDRTNPRTYRGFSYPTYRDIQQQNTVFSDVTAANMAIIGLGPKGSTERGFAGIVSSNYFSVLGVPLARGRTFTTEEDTPGKPATVAIVSYGYWQKHNLDPALIGSELQINGRPFTIVGVSAQGFTGTMQVFSVEVWVPLSVQDLIANDFEQDNKTALADRAGSQLLIFARLKPGETAVRIQPQLEGLAANLEKAFPVEQKNQTFTTTPISRLSLSTSPSDDSSSSVLGPMLLSMAIVVLLVACLNLANMLLARGMARRKEIAIRMAVGGSRARIVRQLLIEGFVLALAGGAGGLILGLWSMDLLVGSMRRMLPMDIVWMNGPSIPILAATFIFCTGATLAFALGPALKLSRTAVVSNLKEQAGEDVVLRRWRFLPGNPLVIVQIALSLALLTAAALFVRGAGKAASVDTGLKPGASFLMETDASLSGYPQDRAQQLYQSLGDRLAALPGVEHVAISATVPFGMISLSRNVQRAGLQAAPGSKPATAKDGLAFSADWNSVGADYFTTVGLPVVHGRGFSAAEATQAKGAGVAVIDDVLAKKLWPDGDALGQYVQYASDNAPAAETGSNKHIGMSLDMSTEFMAGAIQIVGIVPATRHQLFEKDPRGQIYVPFAKGFQSDISYYVRFRSLTRGSEAATAELLRRTVRDTDATMPILSLATFDQYLDGNPQLWIVRAGAALFSIFGVLALGLSVVGLYGMKAYSVARRTREIGIRMALGAQRTAVLGMFMREGVLMLASGIGLGLLLAVGTGRLLSGMLYEVGPLDPVAFTVAPLVLAAAALIATWIPARRATRVTPMTALRRD